jgi:xanthine dehydrogenase accessory factor
VITAAMSRRAEELAAAGTPFVEATVVRAQRPTSVQAGNVALVLADGTIEGFVGGVCTEHSVRAYSLEAMRSGEAVLLRILPFSEDEQPPGDVRDADGAVTVQNPCLSGGAIEVFLEPVLPAPRLLVAGDTPVARALLGLGAAIGLGTAKVDGDEIEPRPGDLALVVAAHGRDELHTLRQGLDAGVAYVGLVASRKRGDGVLAELRGDGVSEQHVARIDVPAGMDIGARTPEEIALSILATIVAVRNGREDVAVPAAPSVPAPRPQAEPAALAVDPICGMTVAAVAATPSVVHDGETVYFCCEGCKAKYEAANPHAGVSG